MGIFGWDYPPGCSSVPGDEPWQCEVCGLVDDCCCPECPECGEQGDPECYREHGMVMNDEQKEARRKADEWAREQDERWAAEERRWENRYELEEEEG